MPADRFASMPRRRNACARRTAQDDDPDDQARAFWVAAPGRGEIRAETLAAPAADEALVRTLFTRHQPRHRSARVQRPGAAQRARAHARAVPGRRLPGTREVRLLQRRRRRARARRSSPAGTCSASIRIRRATSCPADAVHVLPDDVPPARAVLAANLETAVNGLWDAAPQRRRSRRRRRRRHRRLPRRPGSPARIAGCEVELVDVDARKAAAAHALGVPFRTPGAARRDADVVLHASGSRGRARDGARARRLRSDRRRAELVRRRGAGRAARRRVPRRRLTLNSSQVGAVATAQRARWSHARRMQLVLRLLANAGSTR